jgi:hypothetical protein
VKSEDTVVVGEEDPEVDASEEDGEDSPSPDTNTSWMVCSVEDDDMAEGGWDTPSSLACRLI